MSYQNVSVNTDQCKKVGKTLKQLNIRPEFYKRDFLNIDADRETQIRIYFLSVAICHQTHHLFHKELNLWGWEYMEYAFLQMLKEKHPLLNPGYLGICLESDIKNYLQEVFSFDGKKENCSLDSLDERVGMLLEICKYVRENYKGNISAMIDSTKGKLVNFGTGLYEILSRFNAFSDSQKKKITFFLKLVKDAGLIRIKDPENIIPIMDYHMQRVLLRMGCVLVTDIELQQSLINRQVLPGDSEIREACIESIKIISKTSGHDILKMNDFFWPLGRSCCNETTLCADNKCLKQPCTFFSMIDIPSHENCIFENDCLGNKDENFRKLWEPTVETHYY